MGKNELGATSLVAAIPAGILAVLLIMAFLGSTDRMTGLLIGVNAVALLMAILVALMPAAVMVFYGREKAGKQPTEDAGAGAAAAPVATGTTGAVTAEILSEDADETAQEDVGFDDEAVATETDAYEFNADEMDDVESEEEAFEFEDEDEKK